MTSFSAPRLFMCHSSDDKPFVTWLAETLRGAGLRVWLDKWEIKVGDSIVSKVNEGLSTSDYLVVVLSKASVGSRWVQEELNSGILRTIESQGAFVLPVVIEDCQIPPLLAHRRYADFRKNKDVALFDLMEAIRPREEHLRAKLIEYLARFDELTEEIESVSAMGVANIPTVRIFELNAMMEEAVHLRFAHEVDGTALAGRIRWNVFYDEFEYLKTTGLDLSGIPAWGALRNIWNHVVHPSGIGWPDEYCRGLEQLVGELPGLREVLIRLMDFQGGQQDACTGQPASPPAR